MGSGASKQKDEPVRLVNPDAGPEVTIRVPSHVSPLNVDVGIVRQHARTPTPKSAFRSPDII